MIHIELRGKRLCAVLDSTHPHYKNVYIMVRSLLNSREIERDVWAVDYNGLMVLKDKLNKFGLTEDKTITVEANGFLDWISAQHVKNENIKEGIHNEYIKSLLDGNIKTTPYEDQYTAISYIVSNRKCGVFDEMGVGKTAQILWSILALKSEVKKSLVVCPKSVIPGFIREIKKHTNLKYLEIPAGRKTAVSFLKKHKDDDYDIMLVHPENLIGGKKNEIYGPITKMFSKMKWDMIVVDEYHLYKNLSAKRTKCVLSLLTDTRNRDGKDPRKVLMTGTPVSESPLNAYTALKVLSFVPHISRFKHYYCVEKEVSHGSGTHFEIIGYKNLDELKAWLDQVSIRRTKAEMKGFPDKTFVDRSVFLSGKHLEQYNLIKEEALKELKHLDPKEVFDLQQWLGSAKAIRLRQILNHPGVLETTGDSCKYKELDGILEEILADKESKVVVWTEFRAAVDLLYERYNKQYGVQKLYGGVDITEKLITEFEETDKKRIVAAIPAKAGTGTDFLARSRYFIYMDRPYSYTLYKQSLDRGHRRTPSGNLSKLDKIRSSPLTVIFIHAENTIDDLVREKINRKEGFVDALTIKDELLIKMGREEVLEYLK